MLKTLNSCEMKVNMKKLIKVLLALILLITSNAYAEANKMLNNEMNAMLSNLAGTLEITSSKTSANGQLIGCEIVYGTMIFDNTYSKGSPYFVKGSIGITGVNKNTSLAGGIKVATYRIYPQNNGDITTKPERPYFAYLKAANGVNNVNGYLDKIDSDNMDGGVFYVYKFDDILVDIVGQMIDKKVISIAFNRRKDGYDVTVPIDLTVSSVSEKGIREHSNKNINEFSTCYSELLNSVSANLAKNK